MAGMLRIRAPVVVSQTTEGLTNKGRRAPRPPSMTAPARSATMRFPDIVRGACHVLPGARLRRRLFWRYTLVWRQR